MTNVLVTGANGMLGQDLCPILKDNGYEIIATDIHNLDITNINLVEKVLVNENPDIVIHCAAYTNVDKAEEDLETVRLINAMGTENIAKTCKNIDATMLYMSTDYVFDGEKNTPYLTTDVPNPINNYGLTKFEGELAVQKYCEKYYICRTSWLYGCHGKNFVETMISSKDKEELKVVDDQIGCPTWTIELCNVIVQILNEDMKYGIYHACGQGETSWYSYASEIFRQMKLDVNLIPCNTEDFSRTAKRPKYSAMQNTLKMRNWKEALQDYLFLKEKRRYKSERHCFSWW